MRDRRIRTGWYGRYLCGGCEEQSRLYDDYAVTFLREPLGSGRLRLVQGAKPAIEWPNAEPAKLKLFALWCLWRASMCSQPEFACGALGPHGEPLAQLLRDHRPGEIEDFSVVFEAYDTDPTMIWLPWNRYRVRSGENFYKCFIHRYAIHVKVDSQPSPPMYAAVALDSSRVLTTPRSQFVGSRLGDRVKGILQAKGLLE